MGDLYRLSPQAPYIEQLVDQFIKKIVDEERIVDIERGSIRDRIEKTLYSLFHFLAKSGVSYPEDGKDATIVGPPLSVFNWYGPAREALLAEWYRKPPPSARMITERALEFLRKRGFVFERPLLTEMGDGKEVVLPFKRPE